MSRENIISENIIKQTIKADPMAEEATEEEQAEKMVREYQTLQEQLRNAAMQLDQLQAAKTDLERAKEEVSKAEGKVYLTVGGVIVETKREKALSEIAERAELATIRTNSATKQYNELKSREKELGEKLTVLYKQSGPRPAGA